MGRWGLVGIRSKAARLAVVSCYVLFVLAIVLVDCRPASAIPAFARKYGMPCSACHLAWPMLSPFGQQFKDNGLSNGERPRCPHLPAGGLLAGDFPHYADLASGKQ